MAIFLSVKLSQILTGDSGAGDGVSTIASVEDGLNAVGVLSSRYQAGDEKTSSVRCLFLGRLAFLTGEHRQLGRRRETRGCQEPRKYT